MKKNLTLLLVMLCIAFNPILAQQNNVNLANDYLDLKGEVIFSFKLNDKAQLPLITKEFAIVDFDTNQNMVKVMATKSQFTSFLQKKIPFTIASEDNIIGYRTMTSDLHTKAVTFPLTAYPTYDDYENMMNDFAATHPTLCKVENIGTTTEGDKSLLFVKLSNNVALDEQEPRVMYTSSMHGDEIAGYPMMLNLIDLLLNAYKDSSHPRHIEIKELLDNNEVWINPLANPDGTFRNSPNNTSVANATRGNANNVDLNRNYPDPDDGPNPDGNAYQKETLAFMDFAATKHFVLSANFHGGIELVNYPWDTFAGAHPDEDYFVHVSEEYRDLCQSNSPTGYFDDLNNGITNGYAWYEVQGGRQDYQIHAHKGREITVELSNAKTPPANQLVNYWNYNEDALIAFLKQVNYGIRGVVTDAITNEGIEAKITIVGKENYESWVPTELPEGDYYRPIKAGTYDILFEADCYEPVTITGVNISDYDTVIKNVQLTPLSGSAPTGLIASDIQATTATLNWDNIMNVSFEIRYKVKGASNWSVITSDTNTVDVSGLIALSTYEVQVKSNCGSGVNSPYSAIVEFTTVATQACTGINSFPYKESFETGFGEWSNADSNVLDWSINSGSTPSSSTGPSAAQDGNSYIYTEASSSGNPNKTALLNSPCIDLSGIVNPILEYNYHMYGTNMGSLEVLISTNDGVSYTSVWSKTGNQGDEWKTATINLSSFIGEVIKLQVKGTTGSGFRSDIAIDNIELKSSIPDTEAPSIPTNLTVNSISASGANLSWSAATDNVGVAGYEVLNGANRVAEVNANSYIITSLNANSTYSFSVKAKDAAGNTSSASQEVTFTTLENTVAYCDSKGNNSSFEYIDYVNLGGISNISGTNSGYGNFVNLVGAVNYGTNTIVIRAGFANTAYREYWSSWIDYNQDGTFDNSEQLFTTISNANTDQSFDFDVPNTAISGVTRMRISMKYASEPSACETFSFGEVEDYSVDIGNSFLAQKYDGYQTTKPKSIFLYPNPVIGGELFLDAKGYKITSYTIINYLGQVVAKNQLKENTSSIDVSDLSKGIYMIEIDADLVKKIKRFSIR
ncbi:M14 family zinc carboxypeptidase [Aquimarina algicola]|uniref:T9SS type A sorting domain-containing protein n=1 Tax=Aquimarina algicola TaxID=2589995 RepID=A0A504JLT6_9FLAO|nr:M14 family zinc carboxypeptidase [Aquimarina algicola]TPN88748.1 T9SS type A sorting domain-containing protein [Aquimarina algicola]